LHPRAQGSYRRKILLSPGPGIEPSVDDLRAALLRTVQVLEYPDIVPDLDYSNPLDASSRAMSISLFKGILIG